jgi:hypothetical protein
MAGAGLALGAATGAALATGPLVVTVGEALATGSGEFAGADGAADDGSDVMLGAGAGAATEADADGAVVEVTRGVGSAAGADGPCPGLAIA